MEERSAAAYGEEGSSDEGDFGEGYEAEELVLSVQQDDLQHGEPRLQVTRGQRRQAGEMLVIEAPLCKQKDCPYCAVKACKEAGEPEPCPFCSARQRPDLCMRKKPCRSWSKEQRDDLEVARGVQEAIMKEEEAQKILLPATATSTPRKEASVGDQDLLDEEGPVYEGFEPEIPVQMRIEERSGTKPRRIMEQRESSRKGPLSLAARSFVERKEESGKYYLRMDLNQLAYPFKPQEFQMTTRENKLLVKAVHLSTSDGSGNTPTRSKDAAKSWTQEFELPPYTSEMAASCCITQDNLAVICFEEKADPPPQEEEEDEDPDQAGEPCHDDAALAGPTGEEEHSKAALATRVGSEAAKREWQRKKIREIARLEDELERSFQTKVGLGSQAISPEQPMDVGDEEQHENLIYRDRWEQAHKEWRGQGIPQYPAGAGAKSVHWPGSKDMEESFYSISETPRNTRDPALKMGLSYKPILMPAKLQYTNQVKPYDRGGAMFSGGTQPAQIAPSTPVPSLARQEPRQSGGRSFSPPTQPLHQRRFDNLSQAASPHLSSSQLTPTYADLQFPQHNCQPPSTFQTWEPRNTQESEVAARRKRESQSQTPEGEHVGAPQLAEVLTLLTDRLTSNNSGRGSERHSSLKLPTVAFPRCKYDSSNQTSARQWYQFKCALHNCVAQHKLDTKILLLHYATDARLLPVSMQEVFQASETLEQALETIGSRFPPLNSLHAELVKEILSYPPLEASSEKAKILRCSKLLTTLDEFLRFFKGEASLDLSRDKILFILHNLAGQQEYKQEMLREVSYMDEQRKGGQLYADSLKDFLLRYRLLYVDLHSALQLVGSHSSTKQRSAAVKTRAKPKEDVEPGESKDKCPLCLIKPHKAWSCSVELQKVATGARTLPPSVCAACLDVKKSGHPTKCSIVRSKQKGVYYLYQNLCPKCSINIKICPCQGKAQKSVDPDQNDKAIKSRSSAFRMKIVEDKESEEEWEEEKKEGAQVSSSAAAQSDLGNEVVFLTEEVLILGQDNSTKKIIISYDSHSSSHHCTRDLGSDFNWGAEGESQPVSMLTVAGQITSQMLIFKLKVLTLQGILLVTALEGTWSDSKDEPQLDKNLATEYNIALPTADGGGEAPPRLILGCSEIINFPKRVPTPARLAEKHSRLATFCSQLTGNLLVCGPLDQE